MSSDLKKDLWAERMSRAEAARKPLRAQPGSGDAAGSGEATEAPSSWINRGRSSFGGVVWWHQSPHSGWVKFLLWTQRNILRPLLVLAFPNCAKPHSINTESAWNLHLLHVQRRDPGQGSARAAAGCLLFPSKRLGPTPSHHAARASREGRALEFYSADGENNNFNVPCCEMKFCSLREKSWQCLL